MPIKRPPIENLPLAQRFARPASARPLHRAQAILAHEPYSHGEVVLNDPLDRKFQGGVQKLGLTRTEQKGDVVAPTNRPLAGAAPNNRGGSVKVAGGASGVPVGFNQVVVQTPPDGGEDAETIGVTLGWSFQNASPESLDAVVVQAVADLTWGVGGALFNAQVDWMQGTTFAVPASYLRVAVLPTAGTIINATVAFAASLSYGYPGSSRSSSPARLTRHIADSIDAFGSVLSTRIPSFANSMNLVAFPSTSNFSLRFETVAGAADLGEVEIVGLTNGFNLSEQAIPIPNGARFVSILNNGAVDALNVNTIYNITL